MGVFCNGKCHSTARLDGKTAVITGASSGIGKETALDFYKRGGRVILACRNVQKAEEAVKWIQQKTVDQTNLGELVIKELQLDSLASVRKCAEEILQEESRINILVNNAGVLATPKTITEDGFESQIGTNHFGHFLFTLLLLPKMLKSTPARIVNISSLMHRGTIDFDDINWERKPYSPIWAYSQSKLANILFANELAVRLKGRGITAYSLHPGAVQTELGRHLDDAYCPAAGFIQKHVLTSFFKSAEDGAQTTIYCAVDEKTANESGLFYDDCKIKTPTREARDPELARKLWDLSMEKVGLQDYNPFETES